MNEKEMKMLTKKNREDLPQLYSQEGNYDAKVVVKFFTPWSYWAFYGWEFDGEDTFFGLVCGHEKELGYFTLSEMESVRGPFGLKIERDLHWTPITVRELLEKEGLSNLIPDPPTNGKLVSVNPQGIGITILYPSDTTVEEVDDTWEFNDETWLPLSGTQVSGRHDIQDGYYVLFVPAGSPAISTLGSLKTNGRSKVAEWK